jgi:hypothetical protein
MYFLCVFVCLCVCVYVCVCVWIRTNLAKHQRSYLWSDINSKGFCFYFKIMIYNM